MTISGVGGSQQPTFDDARKAAAGRITKMIQNLGNLLTNLKALPNKLSYMGYGRSAAGDLASHIMVDDGKTLLDQIETIQNELNSLNADGVLKYAMGEKKAKAFHKKIDDGLGKAGVSIRDAVAYATRGEEEQYLADNVLENLDEALSALNDIVKVSYS